MRELFPYCEQPGILIAARRLTETWTASRFYELLINLGIIVKLVVVTLLTCESPPD